MFAFHDFPQAKKQVGQEFPKHFMDKSHFPLPLRYPGKVWELFWAGRPQAGEHLPPGNGLHQSGCCDIVPQAGCLISNSYLFPTVLEVGNLRSGYYRDWMGPSFQVTGFSCPNRAQGAGARGWFHRLFFIRALNHIYEGAPVMILSPSKDPTN